MSLSLGKPSVNLEKCQPLGTRTQVGSFPDPEVGATNDIALTRKNLPPPRYCPRPRSRVDARTGAHMLTPCGRPRCSLECRDRWAKKLALCLRRSFEVLPPTHEVRVTVFGVISDRDLSLAIGRFMRRLRYWLRTRGSGSEYLIVNEWSEGHRHTHTLLRAEANLTPRTIRELWTKTLPGMPFTHHCAPVANPVGLANYVVKHLKDGAKKELAPESFRGRIYSYSKGFFTKPVAALWEEQLSEWYPELASSGVCGSAAQLSPQPTWCGQ